MAAEPRNIAAALVQEHGLEGAKAAALAELLKAQQAGDNYTLSIWREVRQILSREPSDPKTSN